jgi:hypothetical protein
MIAVSGARTKVKLYQCELDAGEHHHTTGARPVGASADRKWRLDAQKHTGAADDTFKQTWRLSDAERSLALHHLTDLTTPAFATVSALAIDGITQRLVASTDAFSLLIWDLDQAALARYSEHRALPLLVSNWWPVCISCRCTSSQAVQGDGDVIGLAAPAVPCRLRCKCKTARHLCLVSLNERHHLVAF